MKRIGPLCLSLYFLRCFSRRHSPLFFRCAFKTIRAPVFDASEIRWRWSSLPAAIASDNETLTASITKSATSSNASSTESSDINAFSLALKN